MKSRIALILVICITIISVSGCMDNTAVNSEKPIIVCTIFPVFDWVCEILGEHRAEFDVQLIGKGGTDLHSYQPSAQDIAMISSCDLFVYVGGMSDSWAEEIAEAPINKNMRAVKLFDVLGDYAPKQIKHTHEEDHNSEYDEHLWLSLRVAARITEVLCGEISSYIDKNNESDYIENSHEYIRRLKELDARYQNAVDASKDKTIIVADRFPFLYMTEDYGINYVAAFNSCSSDTDVSFETVLKLAEAADSASKTTILVTENASDSIAQTVISAMKNKNIEIKVLNSCQTAMADSEKGYYDIMSDNLEALKAALK